MERWEIRVKIENCYVKTRWKRISYLQWKEERLTRLVTSCVETAFSNTLLMER